MRRTRGWLPVVEVLIGAALVGVACPVLVPRVIDSPGQANAFADAAQLHTHAAWLEIFRQKHGGAPPDAGGHQFVLSTWTARIFDHDADAIDRYFTPGSTDPVWRERREAMWRGEDPWPDLSRVTSADTHYAGRASAAPPTATQADEAWVADDNENGWSLRDGAINILLSTGKVRTYSYQDLERLFGVGPFDHSRPVLTHGPDSPIPECRNLAR
ncbi:MAG: hypothetical protein WAT39_15910 [Planctomycetota bacterium]